jgi:endonuclease-3
MGKTQRADVIKQAHKVLKKHFTAVAPPKDRSVLEHLLFACVLEDARHEVAEACFARVQQTYYDWNEIRVTTVRELGDVFRDLPNPAAAATRLKGALQSIFETLYRFDLEDLQKQKLGDAARRLGSFKGSTSFTVAYVVQNALGGHAIPLSRGSLEVCYATGIASRTEIERAAVPGLERAIPKNKGTEFASLLHSLGAEWILHPRAAKTRAILTEIDSGAAARVDELLAPPPAEPPKQAVQPAASKAKPSTPPKAKPAKKATAPKEAAEKEGAAKPAEKPAKEKPKGEKTGKTPRPVKKKESPPASSKAKKIPIKNSKAPSKQLARRKPR